VLRSYPTFRSPPAKPLRAYRRGPLGGAALPEGPAIDASTSHAPPLLLLRIHAEDHGEVSRRRADRLLALPRELLSLKGGFSVERGAVDLAREAVVPGAPGMTPPDRELTVVATVAVPMDAVRLDRETECATAPHSRSHQIPLMNRQWMSFTLPAGTCSTWRSGTGVKRTSFGRRTEPSSDRANSSTRAS
jgi:hypothetical protein